MLKRPIEKPREPSIASANEIPAILRSERLIPIASLSPSFSRACTHIHILSPLFSIYLRVALFCKRARACEEFNPTARRSVREKLFLKFAKLRRHRDIFLTRIDTDYCCRSGFFDEFNETRGYRVTPMAFNFS